MKRFFLYLVVIVLFSLVSCKKVVRNVVENGVEKSVKEFLEVGVEKPLKELISSNSVFKTLYEKFNKKISKDFAESITVSKMDDGLILVSKNYPNSKIKIDGDIITGRAGSLRNSGPVNEFFNHILPNKIYKIDDCFTYKTDKLGRVVEASADRTKAYRTIERNPQRNSDIQKMVVSDLDGIPGKHDAGHLFSNTSGGPNELINQVPMLKELNRNGKWRQLEMIEEQALKDGKQVKSYRKLLYKGDSKTPYAIEFTTIIDGIKSVNVVKNV